MGQPMNEGLIPRRRGRTWPLPFLCLVLALSSTAASDESTKDAALLRRVRDVYARVETLRASFTQVNDWDLVEPGADYRGTLAVTRDGRLRLSYQEPPGHLLVSDGTWLWTYVPESGQAIRSPVARQGATISRLFLDFLAGRRVEKVTWHESGVEIVVEPEPSMGLRWLSVTVDPATALGRVFLWTDLEGNTARYELEDTETGVALDPALFQFVPPPEVEIVEMSVEESQ